MPRWMLGYFWQRVLRNSQPEQDARREDADSSDDEDRTDDEPTENEEDAVHKNETWIDWNRRLTRLTESVLNELRMDDSSAAETKVEIRWPHSASR